MGENNFNNNFHNDNPINNANNSTGAHSLKSFYILVVVIIVAFSIIHFATFFSRNEGSLSLESFKSIVSSSKDDFEDAYYYDKENKKMYYHYKSYINDEFLGEYWFLYVKNDPEYNDIMNSDEADSKLSNGWYSIPKSELDSLVEYENLEFIDYNFSEKLIQYEIDYPIEYIGGYWFDKENNRLYFCHHREWLYYDANYDTYIRDKNWNALYILNFVYIGYDPYDEDIKEIVGDLQYKPYNYNYFLNGYWYDKKNKTVLYFYYDGDTVIEFLDNEEDRKRIFESHLYKYSLIDGYSLVTDIPDNFRLSKECDFISTIYNDEVNSFGAKEFRMSETFE